MEVHTFLKTKRDTKMQSLIKVSCNMALCLKFYLRIGKVQLESAGITECENLKDTMNTNLPTKGQ